MQGEVKGLHAKWMLTKIILTIITNIGILEARNPEIPERVPVLRISGLQDSRIPKRMIKQD